MAQDSDVLVSNVNQGFGSAASRSDHAQAFTTGDNPDGYRVTSVDVRFTSGSQPAGHSMELWSDSSGVPGTRLATLVSPDSLVTGINNFAVSGSAIDLDAETTYHIVWDVSDPGADSGVANISLASSGNEDDGAASGWSIADSGLRRAYDSTGEWTVAHRPRKIAVHGEAKESPVGTLTGLAVEVWDSSLPLSLSPAFSPSVTSYTVKHATSWFRVTATAANPDAAALSGALTLADGTEQSVTIVSGTAFALRNLPKGENSLVITVTEDTVTKTYTLTVQRHTTPGAAAFTAAAEARGRLRVDWTAPDDSGGTALTGYRVSWGVNDLAQQRDFTDIATRSHTISGLADDTAYRVLVQARNAEGLADGSYETVTTLADRAPTAAIAAPDPQPVELDTDLTLDGSASADPDNLGLTYRWTAEDAAQTDVTGAVLPGARDGATATFRAAAAGAYTVTLTVTDAGGDRNAVSRTVTATAATPPAPRSLQTARGDGEVTLTWNAPASYPGRLVGATVCYGTDRDLLLTAEGGCNAGSVASSTVQRHTVTGLANGTVYYFATAMRNRNGTGAYTEPEQAVPASPAPRNLEAAAGDEQVSLTWTNPAGMLTGYTICYGTAFPLIDDASSCVATELAFDTAPTGSHTVTGLTNDVSYFFTLQVKKADGLSGYSSAAGATPATAPLSAIDLTAIEVQPTTGGVLTLTPVFASGKTAYTAQAQYAESAVKLTVTAHDATATLRATLDTGDREFALTSGTASAAQDIAVGPNRFAITVTSGTDSKTYVLVVTRADTAPSAPTDLAAADAAADGQAIVTWSNPPGALTAYRICYKAGGTPLVSEGEGNAARLVCANDAALVAGTFDRTDAARGSHTVTGLTDGLTYRFAVAVRKAHSPFGPYTPTPAAATLVAVPAPIARSDYSVAAGSEPGQLDVTWQAPADGGRAITAYIVAWRETDSGLGYDAEHRISDAAARSYTITGLENGTAYDVVVRAVNAVGTGPAPFQNPNGATTRTTPGAVTWAVAQGDRKGALSVSWTAPADGGSAVTSYRVYHRVDGSTDAWQRATAGGLSTRLTGLADATTYEVAVAAVNANGEGAVDFAAALTATTRANAMPTLALAPATAQTVRAGAELSLTGTATDPDGLGVTWAWSATDEAGATVTPPPFVGATDTDMATFSAAAAGVYTVTATLSDSDDSVTASLEVTVTAAVSAPAVTVGTAAASGTPVTVDWSGLHFGPGTIASYAIEVEPAGPDADLYDGLDRAITAAASATSTVTPGLDNGAAFTVRVRALGSGLTEGEASRWSERASFATPAGPANRPTEVAAAADAAAADALDISWSAPAWNGGLAISGYSVEYKPSAATDWTAMEVAGAAARSARLTGLDHSTAYDLRVAAVNSAGAGAWSATVQATTAAGVAPTGPRISGAAGAADGEAVLTWALRDSGNLPVTESRLRWRERTADSWGPPLKVAGPALTATVTGLDPAKEYLARVRVFNAAGDTGWSGSSLTFAPAAAPTVAIGESDPQSVEIDRALTLSATAADADGTVEAWQWTAADGDGTDVTGTVLSGTDGATATFMAAEAGAYSVTVTVTDDRGLTGSATLGVTVTVPVSTDATLSGLEPIVGSTVVTLDPVFSPTVYAYEMPGIGLQTSIGVTATPSDPAATLAGSLTRGNGETVAVAMTGGEKVTLRGLTSGTNRLTVTVTATDGVSQQAYTLTIPRSSFAPSAAIAPGSAQSVPQGADLALTGSGSDGDGGGVTFAWSAADAEGANATAAVFVGATDAAAATFNSTVPGAYAVTLTVTDDEGDVTTATLDVTVTPVSSDATLSALTGRFAASTLELTPAFAPTRRAYAAEVRHGVTSVTVAATVTEANATLKATLERSNGRVSTVSMVNGVSSLVSGLTEGANILTITVTAQDGRTQRVYRLTVTRLAPPGPPTVALEPAVPQTVQTRTALALRAVARDPDGGAVTWAWTARNAADMDVTGSVLTGANTARATFNAATAGAYTVAVTVTDDEGDTAAASLSVTASVSAPPTVTIYPRGDRTMEQGEEADLVGFGEGAAGALRYAWTVADAVGADVTARTLGSAPWTREWASFHAPAGRYRVTLTVTDAGGLTATDALTLTVTAPLDADATIPAPAVSVGAAAAGGSGMTVDWSDLDFGAGTITGYGVELRPVGPGVERYREQGVTHYKTRGIEFPANAAARSLTIGNLDNGAMFTVRVRARGSGLSGGDSSFTSAWSARRTVHTDHGPPGPPTDVAAAADPAAADALEVNWTAPWDGGLNIAGYAVEYRRSSETDWTALTVAGTGTSARLTGLAPATAYELRVAAVNADGTGPYSSKLRAATALTATAPSLAGVTLTGAAGVSAGAAVLTWSVPDSGNLPLTRSRIRWKERGAANPWQGPQEVTGAATSFTLTGLDPAREHVAQIRLFNAAGSTGWSPNSDRFRPAAADIVPTQPTGLVVVPGRRSISVSGLLDASQRVTELWTCVSTATPAIVEGSCATGAGIHPVAPGGGFAVTVDGLTDGVLYRVAVALRNADHGSPWSDPVAVRAGAPAAAPRPPTGVTVVPGDGSLTVSWTRPAAGATPSGYELCTDFAAPALHRVPDGVCSGVGTAGPVAVHGADTVSATLTGLRNGRGYHVYVRAVRGPQASGWTSTTATVEMAEHFTPTVPAVAQVTTSSPAGGAAGGAGGASANGASGPAARLEARVAFSAPVTVDTAGGSPTLGIALGGVRREAAFAGGSGTAVLTFVLDLSQAGAAASTARVIANGLRRNGATIRGAGGSDAILTFGTAPGVSSVAVAAESGGDGVWESGEAVTVTVSFAEPVEVEGAPAVGLALGLAIGPDSGAGVAARQASYAHGSGTDRLVFSYLLADGDGTVAAVTVPANALVLNGGAIRSTAGLAAGLAHASAARTGASQAAAGLAVADASVTEAAGATLAFAVTLSEAADGPVTVSWATADGTALAGQDYVAGSGSLSFAPGETRKTVHIAVLDDAHDEGAETMSLTLSSASGAAIADAHATGTIVNTDPMPAAWLARFGRSVAEQALDGIAARMRASRSAGFAGRLGGHALSFDAGSEFGPDSGQDTGVPGRTPAGGMLSYSGVPGMAAWGGDAGFGTGFEGDSAGVPRSQSMTGPELLLGSSFSLTGARDGQGGSFALWGRGTQTRFEGQQETLTLEGTVTSGMLGVDYAWNSWTVGLALMQSAGSGDYLLPAETGPPMVEAAAGKIENSLTAAVPWASWRASERVDIWAAAGYGIGGLTLKPTGGASLKTDLSWVMAAIGMRSALLAPPDEREGGPGLAVTSDALWARTSSDKTAGLVATESAVTRLRVGLEGSWTVALAGSGRLVPRLEIGARNDGGDAETGTGFDVGGGVAWEVPGRGLAVEIEGRTLLSHGAAGRKETGYAAAVSYDPSPASARGLSLGLRREQGGRSDGTLDALFAPGGSLGQSFGQSVGGTAGAGSGAGSQGRWTVEAAYGFAAFGGRATSSPHIGFGLSATAREYSLGWRLTPEAPAAALTFGLSATRRETPGTAPDHRIGFELTARW